jgi:hypothetical protein
MRNCIVCVDALFRTVNLIQFADRTPIYTENRTLVDGYLVFPHFIRIVRR